MMAYFKTCAHEIFFMTTEDGFLVDKVDQEIINIAIKIAKINPNNSFLKFNLTSDVQSRAHKVLKAFNGYDMIRAEQGTIYRHSLQHAIWRKDNFLKKLIPNQSPWDFELDNRRSMYDGLDIYATKGRYAVHCGHGYKKGKKVKDWHACAHNHNGCTGLSQEEIDYIESNGWMPAI